MAAIAYYEVVPLFVYDLSHKKEHPLFTQVICQAGIFHGGKALCEAQKTFAAPVSREGVAQWDQELKFPIKVLNVPRMARLCFGIYEIIKVKSKKRGKDASKVRCIKVKNKSM